MSRSLRALSAFAGAILLLALVEFWLAEGGDDVQPARANYDQLRRDYDAFRLKHPHPIYGFFFAPQERSPTELSNESVSISDAGFRGPGPADRPSDRRLAILVGNSVVFGFAPHDSLTITGILNRIQDEYFFVNAGVPSWVSHQMLQRMEHELLDYEPSLVVFWAGYNDASIALRAARSGLPFVEGRIEEDYVGTAESMPGALVPNTSRVVSMLWGRVTDRYAVVSDSAAEVLALQASTAFGSTVDSARALTKAAGADFVFVYQPILHHHIGRPEGMLADADVAYFNRFRDGLQGQPRLGRFLDLGAVFDALTGGVSVFRPETGADIADEHFADRVHLLVAGNAYVARRLADYLEIPSR